MIPLARVKFLGSRLEVAGAGGGVKSESVSLQVQSRGWPVVRALDHGKVLAATPLMALKKWL